MQHIQNRDQLISTIRNSIKDAAVRNALQHGHIIVWGKFKGGYVISADYLGVGTTIGMRIMGMPPRIVCGRLTDIPYESYVGGETDLEKGDFPYLIHQHVTRAPEDTT